MDTVNTFDPPVPMYQLTWPDGCEITVTVRVNNEAGRVALMRAMTPNDEHRAPLAEGLDLLNVGFWDVYKVNQSFYQILVATLTDDRVPPNDRIRRALDVLTVLQTNGRQPADVTRGTEQFEGAARGTNY